MSLLLDVLDTPSEAVQRSVADCLPRLVAPLATDRPAADALLDRLLDRLRAGGPSGYGLRRGAAYGLSGVVRGLGTGCLKGQGVLERLRALLEERSDAAAREGGLLAYECLAGRLGRLFEPYVITTLPLLLAAFGDGAPQASDTAEPSHSYAALLLQCKTVHEEQYACGGEQRLVGGTSYYQLLLDCPGWVWEAWSGRAGGGWAGG